MGATRSAAVRRGETQLEPMVLAHQRTWVARVFGTLGPITLPVAGLPLGVILAVPALILKRPRLGPPLSRAIGWWSVVGALACVAIAAVNGVGASPIVGQLLGVGILIFAYRATIVSIEQAAVLVGWLAASSTLWTIAFGGGYTRVSFEYLWKFGIAYTATTFLLYYLARRAPAWLSIVALLGLGVMGTFMNFRSFGLVCAVAAALAMAKLGRRSRPFWTFLLAAVSVAFISVALPQALQQGLFGRDAQLKTLSQSDDGPLILGGRTEPPLSIAAIIAKPLGWGNAQSIDTNTVNQGIEVARSLGMYDAGTFTRFWIRGNGSVSLHSMLFIPWVEGGVLAAIAPVLLIALFGWAGFVARGRWGVLVTLISVQNIWDILFSPWTGARVVSVAASAILAGFAIMSARASAELADQLVPIRSQAVAGRTRLARTSLR